MKITKTQLRELIREELLNEGTPGPAKKLVNSLYRLQDVMTSVDNKLSDYEDMEYGSDRLRNQYVPIKNIKKLYKAWKTFKTELETTKTQLRKIWPR